VYAVCLWILLS